MITVTISELKNRLSAYLRKVRAGETVLVLDREQPVARLEPVAGTDSDACLARLEAAGLIRRGSGVLPEAFFTAPLPKSRASVVDALLEERAEGR